ncbi:chemotaxis protein CheW [Fusibacter tunisiensis]|uniref:Purine-binding chemotaxis protein CheW n=1 Tax=Fusibacter tunisiensis TaxID=1008308 RepID=A0ABS2MMI9_9FIRM|nr:chemotaxis protein CheW [Fusibacter tunisiensis]MBM7560608.1 purine-binding chemotaxis protein CheW [Fusibacter tunisiensis]
MSEIKEFVTFRLNEEYYGININNVENIEKVLPITRVPYTHDYVRGVINLRGIIVPVVDLRSRFNLEPKENSEESRIIIVNLEDLKIGMLVDASSEVLQIETSEIDAAPNVKKDINNEFIKNIGKKNGRIIMLIDLHKVLNIEQHVE